MTGALRGDHADIDALGGLDVAEVDVEAMGEEEGVAVLEVRGDLLGVQLTLVLIGGQDHDHVGLLTRFLDGQHAQTLSLSLGDRRGTLPQTNPHVNAGVTQVEGVGMSLGAVTNDGNLTVLDDGQVGVVVVVDLCHGVLSPCCVSAFLCFGSRNSWSPRAFCPESGGTTVEGHLSGLNEFDDSERLQHLQQCVQLLTSPGRLDRQ